MSENEKDQINRLWEYKLHLEEIYYNRHNFFLVFESVLLGVVGVLYNRPDLERPILKVIAILGFTITVVWGYAQAWQKYKIDDLRIFLREILPENKATWKRRTHGMRNEILASEQKSEILERIPSRARAWAIRATSPNQAGTEGIGEASV